MASSFGSGVYGLQTENDRRLRHCFQDQHRGHDRLCREMTLKKWLIEGNVFYGGQRLPRLALQDAVDQ